MSYSAFHSFNLAYQKRQFLQRKHIWVKRGDVRWVAEDAEHPRYRMSKKARIGDCQWEAVSTKWMSNDAKLLHWSSYPKFVYPPINDVKFEEYMQILPQELKTDLILEAIAPYFEEVCKKF